MAQPGDKVYLVTPRTTFGGVVHPSDRPFYVLGQTSDGRLRLSLSPQGSLALVVFEDEIISKKPPTTVYDHILDDED